MQDTQNNYRIRSAGDLMRQMGSPQTPVDYVTGKVLKRSSLSGATRYSYCPYCYERVRRSHGDYKRDLKPLQVVTFKNIYLVDRNTGEAVVMYEKEMECAVCREPNGKPKRITLDDFSKVFSESPEKVQEVRSLNLYDENALKKIGFEEFANNADVNSVIQDITEKMKKKAYVCSQNIG